MGCSHGKNASPAATHVPANAAKAKKTLLNAGSTQKHVAADKGALQSASAQKHVAADKGALQSASAQKHVAADTGTLQSPPVKRSSQTVDGELKALFDKMDTDKNGYVDAEELAAALRTESSLKTALKRAGLDSQWNVLEEIDGNGDGKITWHEFQTALGETRRLDIATKTLQLRSKALRIYAMADKLADGRLDVMTLAREDEEAAFVEKMQGILEITSDASFSQTEWLEVIRKAACRNYDQTALFLDLCITHLAEQKEHWPLHQQALNVFRLGDTKNDGQLDMDELTEMCQNADFARVLMAELDLDKNGTISKGEWLVYIKRIANIDQESAAAVLELYSRNVKGELTSLEPDHSNVTQICSSTQAGQELGRRQPVLRTKRIATESTMARQEDVVILEDPPIQRPNQRWWACY